MRSPHKRASARLLYFPGCGPHASVRKTRAEKRSQRERDERTVPAEPSGEFNPVTVYHGMTDETVMLVARRRDGSVLVRVELHRALAVEEVKRLGRYLEENDTA